MFTTSGVFILLTAIATLVNIETKDNIWVLIKSTYTPQQEYLRTGDLNALETAEGQGHLYLQESNALFIYIISLYATERAFLLIVPTKYEYYVVFK